MTHRFVLSLALLCLAVRAEARMVRVVTILDGRTLLVQSGEKEEQIRLAGVEVLHAMEARELLRWTVGEKWVMVEPRGDGYFVYRSPDALFVNRELVLRKLARATMPELDPPPAPMVTFLGVLSRGESSAATAPPSTAPNTEGARPKSSQRKKKASRRKS